MLSMPELEQAFADIVLDKNAVRPLKIDPPYRPVSASHMEWFLNRVHSLEANAQPRPNVWPFRSLSLFRAFDVVLDDKFSSKLTFYGLHVDVNQQSIYEEFIEAPGEQQLFRDRIMYGGKRDVAQVAEAVKQERERRERVE